MSFFDPVLFWLFLSALAAGAVNSIAGGGTLLTFPALLAVLSGPEAGKIANATSTVALVPGSVAGAWGYRKEMEDSWRWSLLLIGPSLAGGTVGSLLVLFIDPHSFDLLIPWLILTAALLFLVQPFLGRLLARNEPAQSRSGATIAGIMLFQLLVAIYGGLFGAGIGILMLSALALMGIPSVHQMNAVKTLLACCINGVSVIVFAAGHKVDWKLAPVMALASIVGGYIGARVARRVPAVLVRGFILAVGFGLAGFYFYQRLG